MKRLKKYAFVVLGSVVMALGLDLFLVPAKIASGGVSGVSTVFHYLTGVPVGVLMLLINIPIFIVGLKNFSRKYIMDSFLGMAVLSVATDLLSELPSITNDVILCSCFGGVFVGLGAGLVFRAGATTGGTDIIVMLLKKRHREFSMGSFVLMIDLAIILFAGFVFRTWEAVLYSAIALIINSYIVDMIVEGVNYAKMVFVISDNPEKISLEISDKLSRGTTCLKGISTYTGKEKNTLLCVVRKNEIARLKKTVYNADNAAFVIVSEAREVLGNGFDNY